MADIAELAQQIAEELGGDCRPEDDGTFTIEILDEDEPLAVVTLYAEAIDSGPADGTELFVVRAAAGELDPAQDFGERFLAEDAATTWFARIYIDADEDQPAMLIAEAALPIQDLAVGLATQAVTEVIELVANAQEYVVDE